MVQQLSHWPRVQAFKSTRDGQRRAGDKKFWRGQCFPCMPNPTTPTSHVTEDTHSPQSASKIDVEYMSALTPHYLLSTLP